MADKKILIIDDDKDFIASTKIVLESKGYEVACAMSKDEGIEKIQSQRPDLIISDVMMDRMSDGFDLVRKLKTDGKYKEIPILVLTAVGGVTGFHFSVEAGDKAWLPADDYAEKPLAPDELISRVEALLLKG